MKTINLDKIKENLNKILSERTGKPLEQVEKDTDRDNFLTAKEAKEYGLVDEVMSNINEITKEK